MDQYVQYEHSVQYRQLGRIILCKMQINKPCMYCTQLYAIQSAKNEQYFCAIHLSDKSPIICAIIVYKTLTNIALIALIAHIGQ